MTTTRPNYSLMKAEFDKYLLDRKPCKFGYTNQCAIRTSLALARCGVTFELFQNQGRIHQGRTNCQLGDTPHIVGAEELMLFLKNIWNTGETGAPSSMKKQIKDKRGIVYFNNCFKRKKSDTSLKGDHIDLWTGEKYYNQIIKIGAGGDAGAGADLFARADSVTFFWLPD